MREFKSKELASKAFNFLLKKPNPKEIMWLNFAVTYLCNSRCVMCSIWRKYKENPELFKHELSLSEIESILQSEYLRNLQGISFTGGEPFLRKDFVDLVGLFIERFPDAFVGIATNGLNPKLIVSKTEEILDTYKPKQRFSISISLDGIGEKHDEMRGVSNAYERVMETVSSLRDGSDINLGFDFTITPQNYTDLLRVYELSKKVEVKFLVGFAHSSDIYYDNVNIALEWREEELEEADFLIQKMVNDRIKNESFVTKLIDPYAYFVSKCIEYQKLKSRIFNCYSGTHSLFLDPYGNIYPCMILDKKVGNIKDESFDKLWMSPWAEEIREHIRLNKCHCWVACEAVPSLLRGLGVVRWNIANKILRRGGLK